MKSDAGAGPIMLFSKGHFHRIARLATVLLALVVFLPSAFAAEVAVRGNHRVDSETIRSYFAGTSTDDVNKGVKDLYATGLFSDVKVSRGGGGVVITVIENRSINRVAFEGNSKVKSEQLSSRGHVEDAWTLQPDDCRRRHRADQRRLSPIRPRRRDGHGPYGRCRQRQARCRLHHQRGRQDRRQADQFRRQQGVLRRQVARPHGHDGNELPVVLQVVRRL